MSGKLLILKINDIKEVKQEKNFKKELEKVISETKNNQLNRLSIMYFNKIKEDVKINEI